MEYALKRRNKIAVVAGQKTTRNYHFFGIIQTWGTQKLSIPQAYTKREFPSFHLVYWDAAAAASVSVQNLEYFLVRKLRLFLNDI